MRTGVEQATVNMLSDLEDEAAKQVHQDNAWKQLMVSIEKYGQLL